MLAIAGIIIVFIAVFGGYVLEQGNPHLLIQPAEILIVVGAALGIAIAANPPRVIRKIWNAALEVLRAPLLTRRILLRYLLMLYETFQFAQRSGMARLEEDVEKPGTSRIFSRYPEFLRDAGIREFLCDSLRMLVIGATSAAELDHLMDLDIDIQRRGHHEPAAALGSLAEALPGLGIVAAVLGVVITMGAIGGAPESVGQKVAAALVGTFLGILLCYGVVGPLVLRLEGIIEQRSQFLQVLRAALSAYARGAGPILAVEYARRSIPVELRPSFLELEAVIKRDAAIPAMPDPAPGQKEAAPATAA